MKKKLLLLGGSAQQVPAIKKAKQMGYETVLIDYLPDNPGQFVADKWYQESTTDIDKVYEIAKKENVDGILAYASDPAALPAALVAERLGLPTNPPESVRMLGIKHEFRNFLKKNGFPCPEIFVFTSDSEIEDIKNGLRNLNFPVVIKPTDSSGSKGVSVIKDMNSLENAVKQAKEYSRNKILIAEEFIERGFPDVIGGDIFVENGMISLYGDMACLRGDNGNNLIPIGKKLPNGLSPIQKYNLYKELQNIVSQLNIQNGELNIELLIDKNDIPYFLELGPRAGGNMIPIQLSDIYKIDLVEANIKAALGEPVNLKPVDPSSAFMTYVVHSKKDGIFQNIDYSPSVEPYIYRKEIYKKTGDRVEAFDGAGKAIGIIFMRFPNEEIMNNFAKEIENHIQVVLE